MKDMIGPTITTCLSINHDAPNNEAVIGGELYERVKNFNEYKFKRIEDFSLGLKFSYPVYIVQRK